MGAAAVNGPIIQVENLCVSYPDGRSALEEISFRIDQGESVALLGANGAGKSTLLLSLVGILRGSGEIRIDGLSLTDKALPEIRRTAQILFQDPNDQLFMPALEDDVAFGPLNFGVPADEAATITGKSLAAVGLQGFERRSPHSLSLGERRRAAIAAVLACDPKVLLLDEPNAGLDPRGRRELADLLNSLESTKLIATHDLLFAEKTCERAIVLAGGRIVAAGPLNSILQDGNLLDRSGLI